MPSSRVFLDGEGANGRPGGQGEPGTPGSLSPEGLAARDAAIAAQAGSETARTGAETARTGAESARTGSEAARTGSVTAQTGAESASTSAVTARTGAESARDGAVTARTGAETARTGAVTASTSAATARDGAVTARTGSESARDSAVTARTGAESARDGAVAIAGPVDGTVEGLIKNTGGVGPKTSVALAAAIEIAEPRTGFVMELVTETATTTAVVPNGSLDGIAYGRKSDGTAGLYKSTDDGTTWTLVTATVTPFAGIHALGDGEVLVCQGATLKKSTGWASNPSTATWATVLTANGTSAFIESDVDTHANIVIAAEYVVPHTDARYVYVSTNSGATFTIVRDLTAMFPANKTNTHWHAVAIDRFHTGPNPRLWISHGDGPRGVYYSDDLGATWIEYGPPDTWQPMPMMATEHGIVTSTDQNNPDGVWLIPRNLSARVLLARIPKPFWLGSLVGFGIGAVRDEATGIVYITFRADQQTHFTESNKAIIFATDGQRANIIYETVQGGTVGVSGSTNFEGRPALTASGFLLTTYNTGTSTRRVVKGRVRRGSRAANQVDPGNVLTGRSLNRTSIAIGYGVEARSQNILIGALATSAAPATDNSMVVIGEEAIGGNAATLIGFKAKAGNNSVGLGNLADAGLESVVIGSAAVATGRTSVVVIGRQASSVGDLSVVIGKSAIGAAFNNITAIGNVAQGTQVNATAIGGDARATAAGAVALGVSAYANGTESVALGKGTVVPGGYAVGVGYRTLEIEKFFTNADASAPTANKARFYVKDNGAGKMQLCARFPTGAVQILATEP